MKPATSSAQQAGASSDARRRSTRREIERWLLACAAEGKPFELHSEYDGGALLALRLDVCDVLAQATS